jgi:hypothetical protein
MRVDHRGRCLSEEAYKAKGLRDAEIKRKRIRKRQQLLDEWKTSQGCVDCGYNTNARALDFDHRLGVVKYRGISELVINNTWAAVMEEIEKCDLRCANCHRIKTFSNSIVVS